MFSFTHSLMFPCMGVICNLTRNYDERFLVVQICIHFVVIVTNCWGHSWWCPSKRELTVFGFDFSHSSYITSYTCHRSLCIINMGFLGHVSDISSIDKIDHKKWIHCIPKKYMKYVIGIVSAVRPGYCPNLPAVRMIIFLIWKKFPCLLNLILIKFKPPLTDKTFLVDILYCQ